MNQQPENLANWSMDSIFTGRNWKMQKLERMTLALCILMSIICGILLYSTFFPANSLNPEQKEKGFLEKEIGEFSSKIGQLLEKGTAQRALKKLQNEINDKFRAKIEQQAREIGQMLDEANGQKALVKLQNETIHELRAEIDQMHKEANENITADEWGARNYSLFVSMHKEIEALRRQISQMLDEDKLRIDTIARLRAKIVDVQKEADSHKICQKEQKQKQANWAKDGTFIGAIFKMQKLEFFALIMCILIAIICGTFLYATFFSANSSNPGSNGLQKNEHLHKEIEALRSQIGQMAEEVKTQQANGRSSSSSKSGFFDIAIALLCYIGCLLALASFFAMIVLCCVNKRPWKFADIIPAIMTINLSVFLLSVSTLYKIL